MAFAVRMSLFIGVTLYAWLAVIILDFLRQRQLASSSRILHRKEPLQC
jgi:hypothetical protein